MYAIIEVGGRQYRVQKGDIIDIEHQDKKEGKSLILSKVLLIADKGNIQVGQPRVPGAKVSTQVLKNFKARKCIAYNYLKRKASHKKRGYRQFLSKVLIKEIACQS